VILRPHPHILAVDPGNTTGVGVMEPNGYVYTREVPGGMEGMVGWVTDFLTHGRPDLLVYEKWVIDAQTHRKTRQPDAMDGAGWLRGVAIEHHLDALPLRAVDHKPRSGVKKLRREGPNMIIQLGWAEKSKDRHMEDAGSLILEALRQRYLTIYARLVGHLYVDVTT
jgi:hypothetical protein